MKMTDIDFRHGAGLAPMAGVTDLPMRLLCREQGAAWSVSEMLSAKGFMHTGIDHRVTRELIVRAPQEGVSGLQLFGREPDVMAEAARRLQEAGYAFIDVNMGCPAHKIVGNGEGSALMKEPELAAQIVRAMVDAVACPVTVKIRAGWDESCVNAPEMAKMLEQAGAAAITVHGRTRTQFYAGRADWDVIRHVKRAVRIPVFGNGDVCCGADALRMLDQTGCDGVMVGRAAQGNPWVFRDIACALNGVAFEKPTIRQRVDMAVRHMDMESALRGENRAVLEMRKHVAWYMAGERGCGRLRERINALTSAEQVRQALYAYLAEQGEV